MVSGHLDPDLLTPRERRDFARMLGAIVRDARVARDQKIDWLVAVLEAAGQKVTRQTVNAWELGCRLIDGVSWEILRRALGLPRLCERVPRKAVRPPAIWRGGYDGLWAAALEGYSDEK